MHILKVILWSALCVGLGVFLSTWHFGGQTPVQSLEHGWKQHAPKFDRVKEGAEDLVDGVKKKVASVEAPVERHSDADRDAVNKLITRRQGR